LKLQNDRNSTFISNFSDGSGKFNNFGQKLTKMTKFLAIFDKNSRNFEKREIFILDMPDLVYLFSIENPAYLPKHFQISF
jgi:hypothetical protein